MQVRQLPVEVARARWVTLSAGIVPEVPMMAQASSGRMRSIQLALDQMSWLEICWGIM